MPGMPEAKKWTVHDVWAKYEDIAMHFNDLLIRLRTQALAAVAALSTLVGIFTKTDPNSVHVSWEIATAVFLGLSIFWIAIWIIDFCYYNRLLIGAVAALKDIEAESQKQTPSLTINISTKIEQVTARILPDGRPFCERVHSKSGAWLFYILVLIAILGGATYSFQKELATQPPRAYSPQAFVPTCCG
jgi:hypothetical protein